MSIIYTSESLRKYKIIIVGDIGTGKSAIIKRFIHNTFSKFYKSTFSADFVTKQIDCGESTIVTELWDIPGQERFGNLTHILYKEAVAAIVVFDVCRVSTFSGVTRWKTDIDSKITLPPNDKPLPVLLLANKCDLAIDGFFRTPQQMEQFCEENGFIGWFETSPKENVNIDQSIQFLVKKMIENTQLNN
eukprot:TRINITY_DN2085_c0_g1_i1.p1 TRINITY_DN2085_c0_g1~~TRINITY_DN2085_c0_g1_i1.p1  ORF type:complete len:189 (+),score=76.34 TRINITY_DN2085_c0_g1_i1:83-649(+)